MTKECHFAKTRDVLAWDAETYHTVGNNNEDTFLAEKDYQYHLNCLLDASESVLCIVYSLQPARIFIGDGDVQVVYFENKTNRVNIWPENRNITTRFSSRMMILRIT